ncbi:hypothetical protein GF339_18325 [candidate division KSB3 bacterium]|uniref:Uncharacterized protein n=1 Tax=candidate division KSB3 bacterium TaxID=2044937 RepID=A0A9D5Q7Q4_9BACT|nr:hypothetical protein [candidate division KSB3 bacterium]
MGDITIHVPQRIHIEYTLENEMVTRHLLDVLNAMLLQSLPTPEGQNDALLGLFADQPELLDQVTEQAMQARETVPQRIDIVHTIVGKMTTHHHPT